MHYVTTHGAKIPALGFGVFRMRDADGEAIVSAVLDAEFRNF